MGEGMDGAEMNKPFHTCISGGLQDILCSFGVDGQKLSVAASLYGYYGPQMENNLPVFDERGEGGHFKKISPDFLQGEVLQTFLAPVDKGSDIMAGVQEQAAEVCADMSAGSGYCDFHGII
jgi:hypothetical protein